MNKILQLLKILQLNLFMNRRKICCFLNLVGVLVKCYNTYAAITYLMFPYSFVVFMVYLTFPLSSKLKFTEKYVSTKILQKELSNIVTISILK